MGGRLFRNDSVAQDVLDCAERMSGVPLRTLMMRGPASELMRPDVLEPAIVGYQSAYVMHLRQRGQRPSVVAGYSLGELTAHFAAGVLGLEDTLRIAVLRGRYLRALADNGDWRMVLASGVEDEDSLGNEVAVAGWNAPSELTLVGTDAAVRREERLLLRKGARISDIATAGPWHCELARSAANEIGRALDAFDFREPELPVYLGSTGGSENRPEELRRLLSEQIAIPVRWREVANALWAAGVHETLEIGPGRTLTAFLRRNWRGRPCYLRFLERHTEGPSCTAPSFATTPPRTTGTSIRAITSTA
jgi:[acyl-carrier-protein] S-malonyltransferase